MKRLRWLSFALSLLATAVHAEDFDGSTAMICEVLASHDCLPQEKSCKPLSPEPGQDMRLRIDVPNKTVTSPFRTSALPLQSVSNNTKSLVLQGKDLELVWSATIHRTTGRLTVVTADREGAYVVFGQCKLATGANTDRSAQDRSTQAPPSLGARHRSLSGTLSAHRVRMAHDAA